MFDYYKSLPSQRDPKIEEKNKKKCTHYLLNLEMQGVTAPNLYYLISESFSSQGIKYQSLKTNYESIAIEKGSEDAMVAQSKAYYWGIGKRGDMNRGVALIKDAVNKYGFIQESIDNDLIDDKAITIDCKTENEQCLTISNENNIPNQPKGRIGNHRLWELLLLFLQVTTRGVTEVSLGNFASFEEMTVYYSDMLIKYRGYRGYEMKAGKYYQRKTPEGRALGTSILEEADQKGKGTGSTYEMLINMYK